MYSRCRSRSAARVGSNWHAAQNRRASPIVTSSNEGEREISTTREKGMPLAMAISWWDSAATFLAEVFRRAASLTIGGVNNSSADQNVSDEACRGRAMSQLAVFPAGPHDHHRAQPILHWDVVAAVYDDVAFDDFLPPCVMVAMIRCEYEGFKTEFAQLRSDTRD
jgi:hypothetical protein